MEGMKESDTQPRSQISKWRAALEHSKVFISNNIVQRFEVGFWSDLFFTDFIDNTNVNDDDLLFFVKEENLLFVSFCFFFHNLHSCFFFLLFPSLLSLLLLSLLPFLPFFFFPFLPFFPFFLLPFQNLFSTLTFLLFWLTKKGEEEGEGGRGKLFCEEKGLKESSKEEGRGSGLGKDLLLEHHFEQN